MKISRSKTNATLIALFLMLTITATSIFVALPSTNAHDPPVYMPTNAYVNCAPPVIGLGQSTAIVVWLDRTNPTSTGTSGERWSGFLLTITKPDGSNMTIETLGFPQCHCQRLSVIHPHRGRQLLNCVQLAWCNCSRRKSALCQ